MPKKVASALARTGARKSAAREVRYLRSLSASSRKTPKGSVLKPFYKKQIARQKRTITMLRKFARTGK